MVNNFEGTLKTIYKKNHLTGNTCFGIGTDELDVNRNRNGEVVCEGIIPSWPVDTYLILSGEWDSKGEKFLVDNVKPYTNTKELSQKLLKRIISDLKEKDEMFKIGSSVTRQILELSEPDILTFMRKRNSLDLMKKELRKVDEWKIEKIYEAFLSIDESYSVIDFISKFGGDIDICDKLIKTFGTSALKRIKSHPYKIGYLIGMDFYATDRMGKHQKMDPLCKERIEAIIYEAVNSYIKKTGSTYITQQLLKKRIECIIKKSSFPDTKIPFLLIGVILGQMSYLKTEIIENILRIYNRSLYEKEWKIVKQMKRLNTKKIVLKEDDFEKVIENRKKKTTIEYSEEQKTTFNLIKTEGVKILTGGPGVGKTTTINEIINYYITAFPGKTMALCAPTGRAAQRMSDITGLEAKTIHKLLNVVPFDNEKEMVCKDENDPINADFIIVDEMSMVGTELFSLLLPAIKKHSTLLLVGDENQLPSVEAGNILHDLIESELFETYRLTKVYRQKGDNTIIDNAYKVLNGDLSFIENEKFRLYKTEKEEDAVEECIKLFKELNTTFSLKDISILSPYKITECGTYNVNENISELLNDEKSKAFYYGKSVYKLNDKVIFNSNNYVLGYYNGDIGYITDIIPGKGVEVKIESSFILVSGKALKDLSLAYAISIHKSQGSEFNEIIIVLTDVFSNILNKNLLFTAITRAKNSVKIIYVNNALKNAVKTIAIGNRKTGLNDKLRKGV